MNNYGEELAYWYLRLNGFFPLTNFVLHRGEVVEHSADCDLIALRLPCVDEDIGGQADDWDTTLFDVVPVAGQVAILGEVKTGRRGYGDVFSNEKLRYALRRLGTSNDVESILGLLTEHSTCVFGDWTYAKLLFSPTPIDGCHHIPLDACIAWIQERLRKYANEKYADRIYFPSSLMQYLIHQARLVG